MQVGEVGAVSGSDTARPGKALVILNPVAGNSSSDEIRRVLDESLVASGWQYRVYETTGHDNLAEQVAQAKKMSCTLVIAAGGDGTVSAVAQHLMHTQMNLGILPAGTANVLSLELGIPQDIRAAAALLASDHRVLQLDLMQVEQRYFILQIGVGIDAEMIKDTPREAKRRLGRLAYMGTLVGKLFGYHSHPFDLRADGRTMRVRAWQVLVANAGTLGTPPFKWGPDIHPDDGELNLCIVKVRMPSDYLRLAWQLLTGHYKNGPNIAYVRVRDSARIASRRPQPVQADGEILGNTPVEIRVVPRAIRVLVPPETEKDTASPIEIAEEADERHG